MEVTFPITVLIVLCFAVVARRVLIIHQCFSYCGALLPQHEGCHSNHPHPHSPVGGGGGWARGWERTEPGQLTQTDKREIPLCYGSTTAAGQTLCFLLPYPSSPEKGYQQDLITQLYIKQEVDDSNTLHRAKKTLGRHACRLAYSIFYSFSSSLHGLSVRWHTTAKELRLCFLQDVGDC